MKSKKKQKNNLPVGFIPLEVKTRVLKKLMLKAITTLNKNNRFRTPDIDMSVSIIKFNNKILCSGIWCNETMEQEVANSSFENIVVEFSCIHAEEFGTRWLGIRSLLYEACKINPGIFLDVLTIR
jgi:hypothetical protein